MKIPTWLWIAGGGAALWWWMKKGSALTATQTTELTALYQAALLAKGKKTSALQVWQGAAPNNVCVGWTLEDGSKGGQCFPDVTQARAAAATIA